MDEKLEKKSEAHKQSVPGLYFILDGQSYIVNHTLISKISFPQNSNGGLEPPSALIGNSTFIGFQIFKLEK